MKRKGKKYWRKITGILLALCMVLSIAPMTAFAGVTDLTGGTPSTVYKHTYHTKIKMTANVTVLDSEGNTVDTYPVSEESDDFLVGNVSDDAVQAEITRLEAVVNSQLPSGAVKSNRTTSTTFDHFESSCILETDKEGNTTSTLDVHEYQIYEIIEDWTVQPGNYAINNVVINKAPTSCTVGEAPKAMATKGDDEAYTFCEYWEEWAETEEGLEPVKFWYSDADRMSRVPENQILTAFEEGKKYLYSIIAQPKDDYTFAEKDAIGVMLNGEDISNSKSIQLYDNNGEKLLQIMGKFITPTNNVYGDSNGDGKVTAADVLLIRKSIAGQSVTLNNAASDVNVDGKLTAADVLMIRKFIAGQNIQLGQKSQ